MCSTVLWKEAPEKIKFKQYLRGVYRRKMFTVNAYKSKIVVSHEVKWFLNIYTVDGERLMRTRDFKWLRSTSSEVDQIGMKMTAKLLKMGKLLEP